MMAKKRTRPLIEVNYCVCCDCFSCRAESGGGKFMFLWGMKSKRDALAELAERRAEHSDRCFLAKETTEEIIGDENTINRRSTSKKRKAA